MKAFISYRFTGEKMEDLKTLLSPIQAALEERGVDAYCNLNDAELEERSRNFAPQDYVFDAFKIIDTCDMLFVVITSESKSEGMILEVGYAIAKNIPVTVAIKSDITNTYLPGMAREVVSWENIEELADKIKNLNIH